MKKVIVALFFFVLLSSCVSAEIIFTQPLKSSYNLGDTVFVPITIKSIVGISGVVEMNLICSNETEINFYKNGVSLNYGEPKSLDSSLVLIRSIIGGNQGACKVKVVLGSDYALSSEFKISNLLSISGVLQKSVFDSGENVQVSGKITKENGENANGFVDASITTGDTNKNVSQSGIINNGEFAINVSLPSDLKAGDYFLNLNAYEKDSDGLATNAGNAIYNISVRQVPTNLELKIENKEINPGEQLSVSAILHDQTGNSINSSVFITLKNSADKIIEQKEINAGEYFSYTSAFNEPPAQWKIFAASNKLTAEDEFIIKQKESVDIQIINKTISVTNNGNVPYNKTLLVKIGDTPLNVGVELNVGESKKYALSAPNGDYTVRIVSGSDNEVTGTMSLTGNAVGIREASWSSFGIIFGWVFLFSILATGAFFAFKRIRKKPFFAHAHLGNVNEKSTPVLKNNSITQSSNKAEMSLSIKGEKQNADVICLKVKNLRDMRSRGDGSASEKIKKIIGMAEENNAAVYENQDYTFFILAPIKTRTFKNEKVALDLAQNMHQILMEHNRMFNQKMEFGISLNYGEIIAKVENGSFKFMSLGSLITLAKKTASLSNGEILLSDKINDMVRLYAKTEKDVRDGTPVFTLTGIKKEDEAAKKFINRFMERQRKE